MNRIFDEQNYKSWRLQVYQRDRFACRKCGKRGRGVRLQAHHIRRWADFPELRYEVSNGITLCYTCHSAVKDCEDLWAPVFMQILSGR